MNDLTIELEDEVFYGCEQRIQRTSFDSVEEYIAFIIAETVSVDEIETNESRDVSTSEDHLRALGYIE